MGYRVLLDNIVITARHVDIIENDVKCIGLNVDESENNDFGENSDESVNDSADEDINNVNIEKSEPQNEHCRSQRIEILQKKLEDYVVYNGNSIVNCVEHY